MVKVGVTSGEIEVRRMWVLPPGETRDARKVNARKVGVSPGEIVRARKTIVSRTKSINCLLDNNCIITRLKC